VPRTEDRAITHDAPDSKLIFDRFWIDHEPRTKHETFLAMWVMSEQPVGRFVPTSASA
jgi:hypothetical protein